MKHYFGLLALAIVSLINLQNLAVAQTSFTPENLGTNVNSSYSEINPVVSVDGKTLFFTRVNHPQNRFGEEDSQDICAPSYRAMEPGVRLNDYPIL